MWVCRHLPPPPNCQWGLLGIDPSVSDFYEYQIFTYYWVRINLMLKQGPARLRKAMKGPTQELTNTQKPLILCRYENRDINGEFQTGFMIAQGTTRRGSRCSTGKAFLRPARLRKNLHVAMESHVTRLLIDPVTKRAFGVEFSREGKLHVIRAKKEVIVSGGSVNSPQLLMLSGIGPREHLQVRSVDHCKVRIGYVPE